MTDLLQSLVADASRELGSDACSAGKHEWTSEGGRGCPKELGGCSQTVYLCRVCGTYDYGERGGPAHKECHIDCRREPEPPEGPRMPREEAERRIGELLDAVAPGYPTFSLVEDGVDSWAFWISPDDTTSYLHADGRIEWYGSLWPDDREYDGEHGAWTETPQPSEAPHD